jgi:O-antigen ligase
LERPVSFFAGLIAALALVIAVGFEQHFGGLKASREYFYTYVYPTLPSVPPEYLKKISSERIFSTLFYPNALAGALLMLMPAALTVILKDVTRLTVGAWGFVAAVVGGGGLACLYWSGSKGGWLLMLLLGLIVLLRMNFARRWKLALVGAVLVVGLAGFGLKYAGFFRRGATSVSARFDYWQSAARTALAQPVFGTGPGTFAIPYAKIKRPESEMARLVHNDFLQQASDSGLVGLATFVAFVVGMLVRTRPRPGESWASLRFAVWLGLLGWWLQGMLEFGLYIPALAWCGFTLTGWLLATTENDSTTPAPTPSLAARDEATLSQRPKPQSPRPA